MIGNGDNAISRVVSSAGFSELTGVTGQSFEGADFSRTIFSGIFHSCNFAFANFTGAFFNPGTKFLDSNFTGAINDDVNFRTAAPEIYGNIGAVAPEILNFGVGQQTVAQSFALAPIAATQAINALNSVSVLEEMTPYAGFALATAAVGYGLYKANQYMYSQEAVKLHEYPVAKQAEKDAEVPHVRSIKRKEPTQNEEPNNQRVAARPKRRKLNEEQPQGNGWQNRLENEGINAPKIHASGPASRTRSQLNRQKLQGNGWQNRLEDEGVHQIRPARSARSKA